MPLSKNDQMRASLSAVKFMRKNSRWLKWSEIALQVDISDRKEFDEFMARTESMMDVRFERDKKNNRWRIAK